MIGSLDARQLDQAWDTWLEGGALPPLATDEQAVFALLAELTPTRAPRSFTQSLARQLRSAPPAAAPTLALATSSQAHGSRATHPPHRMRRNWSPMWLAAAAIVAIVVLSGLAIAGHRSGTGQGSVIPAMSDWSAAGPPTSDDVSVAFLFAHRYAAGDIDGDAFDELGWIEFEHTIVGPGVRTHHMDLSPGGNTQAFPGFSIIVVDSGQFGVTLTGPARIVRNGAEAIESVSAPGEILLDTGDTLIAGKEIVFDAWNPLDTPSSFFGGGLYTKPDSPIVFFDEVVVDSGASFPPGSLTDALDLSIEQVSIPAGSTFAYVVEPNGYLLAQIGADGLVQRQWEDGNPVGKDRQLYGDPYTLHHDGAGYFTLTNQSDAPIEVALFRVAPVD